MKQESNKVNRTDYTQLFNKDYSELLEKNEALKTKLKVVRNKLSLEKNEHLLEKKRAEKYAKEIEAKDAEISRLNQEIARLNAKLNTDGTNSGLPTSMTPLNKKKVIPNSRVKSGKKKGGQTGHPKHKLESFHDDEIDETIEHHEEKCPDCGSELEKTENVVTKDELEYKLVVIKRRHNFRECRCPECGRIVSTPIPCYLKEDNQYGSNVQSLCLTLMDIGNVPINKVKRIVNGLSDGEIDLSEGYISKLQKRAAGKLNKFIEDSKDYCRNASLLHWDDTVIDINTNRGCLRFYGDDHLALYTAHSRKDKDGLDEDKILSLLPETTVVVHDHNKVNYNSDYFFRNAECCAHLLRDLEKLRQDSGHEWPYEMKELLSRTDEDRKAEIDAGKESFSDDYLRAFESRYEEILLLGLRSHKETEENRYYWKDERNLLERLTEYKDNYCMWVYDFDIPFTNNLAERGLRGAKTKMKVSGLFQNVNTAQYYATIRSYIETCRRNGINETDALIRLCQDNPYSVAEILTYTGAE